MSRRELMNVAVRLVTFGCRFILAIGLARWLDPQEFGLFGLVYATVTLLVYIAGGEFHSVTSRMLLTEGPERGRSYLLDQAWAHLVSYPAAALVGGFLLWSSSVDMALIGLVAVLVVLDHASLETHRVLIALRKPLRAGVVLFLRSGAWVVPLMLVMALAESRRTLGVVWVSWVLGSAIGLIAGALAVRRELPKREGLALSVFRTRSVLLSATPFLVASVATTARSTVDRYLLEWRFDLEEVAVYALMFGIAQTVTLVVESGVAHFRFPELFSSLASSDAVGYAAAVRAFYRSVMWVVPPVVLVVVIGANPLLEIVGREEYQARLPVLWVLLGAASLSAVSQVPHFVLYSHHLDWQIARAEALALGGFVVSSATLVSRWGASGVAMGMFVASVIALSLKLSSVHQLSVEVAV